MAGNNTFKHYDEMAELRLPSVPSLYADGGVFKPHYAESFRRFIVHVAITAGWYIVFKVLYFAARPFGEDVAWTVFDLPSWLSGLFFIMSLFIYRKETETVTKSVNRFMAIAYPEREEQLPRTNADGTSVAPLVSPKFATPEFVDFIWDCHDGLVQGTGVIKGRFPSLDTCVSLFKGIPSNVNPRDWSQKQYTAMEETGAITGRGGAGNKTGDPSSGWDRDRFRSAALNAAGKPPDYPIIGGR